MLHCHDTEYSQVSDINFLLDTGYPKVTRSVICVIKLHPMVTYREVAVTQRILYFGLD
jgi:hypothetical protein